MQPEAGSRQPGEARRRSSDPCRSNRRVRIGRESLKLGRSVDREEGQAAVIGTARHY